MCWKKRRAQSLFSHNPYPHHPQLCCSQMCPFGFSSLQPLPHPIIHRCFGTRPCRWVAPPPPRPTTAQVSLQVPPPLAGAWPTTTATPTRSMCKSNNHMSSFSDFSEVEQDAAVAGGTVPYHHHTHLHPATRSLLLRAWFLFCVPELVFLRMEHVFMWFSSLV